MPPESLPLRQRDQLTAQLRTGIPQGCRCFLRSRRVLPGKCTSFSAFLQTETFSYKP